MVKIGSTEPEPAKTTPPRSQALSERPAKPKDKPEKKEKPKPILTAAELDTLKWVIHEARSKYSKRIEKVKKEIEANERDSEPPFYRDFKIVESILKKLGA